MKLETLRGAVRPVLSLLFGLALVVGFFMRIVPVDAFLPVAVGAIGYWFGQRSNRPAA